VIVWACDYDGGGKAWVRFKDARDAIVGGSRVER
jgi:hydroxyacylglutathione hydrolase